MITDYDGVLILMSFSLSIIGTTYVIVNYLLTPLLQNLAFKFVYNLSIANFLWTLAAFINVAFAIALPQLMINTPFCTTLAAVKLFSHLSGMLWTASISSKLYQSIFKPQEEDTLDEQVAASFRRSYILCYGFPALSAIGLWVSGDYGHVYPYYQYNCFIGDDMAQPQYWLRSLMIRICFYYLPIWILFVYITFLIVRISIFLIKNLDDEADKSFLYKLYLFPVIILVCWVPMTIKKILADFSVVDAEEFSDVDYILIGLNGFLNSLVYSYHTLIKERTLSEMWQSCCCCLCFKQISNKQDSFEEICEEHEHNQNQDDLQNQNDLPPRQSTEKQIELIGAHGQFRCSEFQKSLNSQFVDTNMHDKT